VHCFLLLARSLLLVSMMVQLALVMVAVMVLVFRTRSR
jgi:hypothetical protein